MSLPMFGARLERYQKDEERKDARAALICSVMANLWTDGKHQPQDFMPRYGSESVADDPEAAALERMSAWGRVPRG